MKKYYILFIISFSMLSVLLYGQNNVSPYNKIDTQLKYWLSKPQEMSKKSVGLIKKGSNTNPMIPIIFKSNSANAPELVAKHHGEVHSIIGTIYTAMIPFNEIMGFAGEDDIIKIESPKQVSITNDKARVLIGADKVSAGDLIEGIPYTGKGVIVGIIDGGIDFTHPDFRKKDDTLQTRILSIWDQSRFGKKPDNFNYGAEWEQPEINSALKNPSSISHRDEDGHGTHVAGSAAGLRGIASDANIICVRAGINWESDSTYHADTKEILDAVNYIYQKAGALGKPCVVNLSIGYNIGTPHDGSGLIEQGFDYLVNSRSGFMICVAAGNESQFKRIHFGGFELTEDSVWTYTYGMDEALLYSVFDIENIENTMISIVADSVSIDANDSILVQKKFYQTPWLSISDILDSPSGRNFNVSFETGNQQGSISMIASMFDQKRAELRLHIARNNPETFERDKLIFWKLALKGKGKFHSWWETIQINNGPMPFWFSAPTNESMKFSDDNYNMNIIACGEKVFSVGAYVNKPSYINSSSILQFGANIFRDSSGTLALFSSHGPTTDERIKPDFCAPGVNVASSLSRNANFDNLIKTDQFTVVLSGTSMASPIAAGAVALYLEKFPNASYDEVKNAIITTTDTDSLTSLFGELPNGHFGYGRLNIFKAMGGTSTDNEEHKNQKLNPTFSIIPNPVNENLIINYSFDNKSNHSIRIINELGISVYENNKIYIGQNNSININTSNFNPGVYFLTIQSGNSTETKKFVVVR